MTSNAGAREMVCNTIGFGGEGQKDPAEKGKKAIEQFFSPEFRNRLDDIISFKPLNLKIMEQVVDKFINELQPQLSIKKVVLKLSGSARLWLAKNGHDPHFGARPLDRLIQKEIKDVLTDEILFGRLVKGGEVHVRVKDDKLAFTYS
jgi:ATP-dependent Clp protease ATP-binding subunit ClpA